jgi:type I restriction enzyme S subunit
LLVDREGRAWPSVELKEVLGQARYGTSTKCSYEGLGLPVLRIPNVQSGSISLDDLKFAIEEGVDLTGPLVDEDDILIIRTNGSRSLIGRAAVVPKMTQPLAFASYLIQLRVARDVLDPGFLVASLGAPQLRAEIERLAATTAGQYNISLGKLNSLRIPLPPLDIQIEKLAEAQLGLSHVAELESGITQARRNGNRLRSSILAAAFGGRLVSQDPADEPAAALLPRVAAPASTSQTRRAPKPRGRARTAAA